MLEVCVDSVESAVAAANGGATRIELCSALSEGGLTPTVGALKALKSLPITIPIFCMLRPRKGNDFLYSDSEMDVILYDIALLKSHGCDGFVFGALDENRNIDDWYCRQVVQMSGDLPVTFHRAFDMTDPNKMHETVNKIKSLGFKRILTSGFKPSCLEGLNNLRELCRKHEDIVIMPGAGITADNLKEILLETNCKEFHSSAKKRKDFRCDNFDNISLGRSETDVDSVYVTDQAIVRQLVDIALSK